MFEKIINASKKLKEELYLKIIFFLISV